MDNKVRGGRLAIVNKDTNRVNHVFVYEFFDNLLHDTSDCYWVSNEGRCYASGKFIAWLRKQCKAYGKFARLIDYDTNAFVAWQEATGRYVSGDTATEATELLALAKNTAPKCGQSSKGTNKQG